MHFKHINVTLDKNQIPQKLKILVLSTTILTYSNIVFYRQGFLFKPPERDNQLAE